MQITSLTFNPFSENTFIVHNGSGSATIIDPGFYTSDEYQTVLDYLTANELVLDQVILTHGHLDHVFGCKRLLAEFDIPFKMHKKAWLMAQKAPEVGQMYGVPCDKVPNPTHLINEKDSIQMADETWEILFCPGHSPGSICFYQKAHGMLIAGDVLFNGSIGRTDLPGGSMEELMDSIKNNLLVLDDEVQVFCGHGPSTTIGKERVSNPFLQAL